MADNHDDGDDGDGPDYEVGYGKPPKHTRFPKGTSGNPKGPKKGSRSLKTDLDQALKATLTITVGGKKRTGTTQALAMYALAVKSAAGSERSQKLLAELVLNMFGPGERDGGETKLSKQDAELLERLLERLEPDPRTEEPSALDGQLQTDAAEGGVAGDNDGPNRDDGHGG